MRHVRDEGKDGLCIGGFEEARIIFGNLDVTLTLYDCKQNRKRVRCGGRIRIENSPRNFVRYAGKSGWSAGGKSVGLLPAFREATAAFAGARSGSAAGPEAAICATMTSPNGRPEPDTETTASTGVRLVASRAMSEPSL